MSPFDKWGYSFAVQDPNEALLALKNIFKAAIHELLHFLKRFHVHNVMSKFKNKVKSLAKIFPSQVLRHKKSHFFFQIRLGCHPLVGNLLNIILLHLVHDFYKFRSQNVRFIVQVVNKGVIHKDPGSIWVLLKRVFLELELIYFGCIFFRHV